jgi:hypothetical protein
VPAGPVTQYGEAVMSGAGTNHYGDRGRDGDKQNNQSNDDKHVDASDPGARSPVHAASEALSTMLTYNVTQWWLAK